MTMLTDAWGLVDEHMADHEDIELTVDTDPVIADRMLRRVFRERRLLAEDEAVVQAEKDRLDEWLDKRHAAHDTSFIEMQLRNYHEARLGRDPKAKTIHLPSGTLTARKLPDRWEFDEAPFVEWAQGRRTDLLRTKVEIDKPAVKAALVVNDDGRVLDFEAGEFVEAVTVTPGEVSFAIKPNDEEG